MFIINKETKQGINLECCCKIEWTDIKLIFHTVGNGNFAIKTVNPEECPIEIFESFEKGRKYFYADEL